jgi:hypothetical protein
MSTQPQVTETHKQLAADVFRMIHNRNLTAAAQLLADSEAQAVEAAIRVKSEVLAYPLLLADLTAEREKVRVLREALKTVARFPMERHQDLAKSALAATEAAK